MNIERKIWGSIDEGPIELISIVDDRDQFRVQLSNLGATIVKIEIIDKKGLVAPITLGHNEIFSYLKDPGYFGAIIGRTVSRTVNAQFQLDGRTFRLSKNNGNMHAHGGIRGFNSHRWEITKIIQINNEVSVHFQLISPSGDEGYPGTLTVDCVYTIRAFEISWELTATCDEPTIVNLTNHSYWNLNGIGPEYGNIRSLRLQLNADRQQILNQGIPTAQISSIKNAALDFQRGKNLADALDFGDIDNVLVFTDALHDEKSLEIRKVGELFSVASGRMMEMFSTEPCIIVYTGNYLDGLDSYGSQCKKHDALCLELIRPVNAINFPEFQSWVILRPKSIYTQKTSHIFRIVS